MNILKLIRGSVQDIVFLVGALFCVTSLFLPVYITYPGEPWHYYIYQNEFISFLYVGLITGVVSIFTKRFKRFSVLTKLLSTISLTVVLVATFYAYIIAIESAEAFMVSIELLYGLYTYAIGIALIWLSAIASVRARAKPTVSAREQLQKLQSMYDRSEISRETYLKLKSELEKKEEEV